MSLGSFFQKAKNFVVNKAHVVANKAIKAFHSLVPTPSTAQKLARQDLITKGQKAAKRTVAKAAATTTATQNRALKEREVVRKTAQLIRSTGKTAGNWYRSLPKPVRTGVEFALNPVKYKLSGIMKVLDWVTKQTGRVWTGTKTGLSEGGYLSKKKPNDITRALRGFAKGFVHPEVAPKEIITVRSKRLTPYENRILSGLVEGGLGIVFDPTSYIGIGIASKGAKGVQGLERLGKAVKTVKGVSKTGRTAEELADLVKASNAARISKIVGKTKTTKGLAKSIQIGKDVQGLEDRVTALNNLKRNIDLYRQQKTKELSSLKKGITKAEKAVPQLTDRITKRTEKLAVLQDKLKTLSTVNVKRQQTEAQLQTAKQALQNVFNNLPEQDELMRLTQEMGKLKEQARVASIIGTPERQQELAKMMQDMQTAITRTTESLNKNKDVKALSKQINKLTESLNKMPVESPGAVKQKNKLAEQVTKLQNEIKSLSDDLAKHNLTRQQGAELKSAVDFADDMLKRINAAKGEAYSKIQGTQRTSGYAVTVFGKPVVSIEPLTEALRNLSRKTILSLPESVKGAVNTGVRAFRPLTPLYREGMTPEEHMNLTQTLPWLHQEIRKTGMVGRLAGDEALKMWQKADIPKKARKQIIYYRDLTEADKQAFLDKFAPEVRQQVLDADKVWDEDLSQITKRLEDTFGSQMHEFFGKTPLDVDDGFKFFIESYAPRIFYDPPQKIKSALETWAQRAGKQRVPGSRGFFTRERVDATLQELRDLGLHPVEDPAIFSAAYRATAEQMIHLKKTTDQLVQYGLIRKGKAPAGWGDGGMLFPWLKDYKVHPEVVRAFQTLKPLVELNADELRPLVRAWDYATNMFKGLVTSTRVGFHMVNTMGNIILMRMAGIPYSEVPGLLARAALVKAGKAAHSDEINRYFKLFGLEGQGMFADIVQSPTGLVRHFERQWEKMQGPLGKLKGVVWPKGSRLRDLPFLLEPGRQLGEATDSMFRMATFLHFLDKGISPSEAAGLVKRYLFDYSALTPFERGLRKWIMPFYAWTRYSLPRSILAAIEQPGAYTSYFRLQSALANATGTNLALLPAYNQTAFAVNDPSRPGTMIYINPQPPWQQLMSWASGKGDIGGDITRTWHPIWRAIPILATGVDPLTGQKAEDVYKMLSPGMARLYLAVKTVTPLWEFEKLAGFEKKLTGKERVPVNERVFKGPLGYLTTPLNRYDWQADIAYKLQNEVEPVIDRFKAQTEVKEGVKIPDAGKVLQEVELQNKLAGPARNVLKSMTDDPKKARLVAILAGGSAKNLQELLVKYPEFLEGTPKDVARRMLKLYTKSNFDKLTYYLGRKPKFMDFIRYKDDLMKNKLPNTSPVGRLLEKEIDLLKSAKAAVTPLGSSSSSQVPTSVSRISSGSMSVTDALNKAIQITGVDRTWLPFLQWLVQRESGGNPYIVNPVAVHGEHATGLLQTLPSTFRANALPGMTNITDPVHNAVAAINYIRRTYGHPARIPNIGNWNAFQGY